MIWAANPSLSAQEVQDILEANCDQIGPPSIFGFGRINQFKNMLAAAASNPIDTQPDSISVYEGTYLNGALADILVPNTGGPSYNVRSAKVGRNIQAAGAVITWHPDTTKAKVITMEFFFQTKENPFSIVTAFVYVWNTVTNKYELLFQFPILGDWQIRSRKITFDAKRFLSSTKEVRALVRAVSTTGKGRTSPVQYTLGVGYANLQYTENNN